MPPAEKLTMRRKHLLTGLALAAIATPALLAIRSANASDHADTPELVQMPGADITDVYIFPSPDNAQNVVFIMNVNPLITPANKNSVSFDPNVLYQFKIDTDGDDVEDMVIQAKFTGTGANQQVAI